VLDVIESTGLLDAATKLGDALTRGVLGLGHPLVASVRGVGLWRAIVLTEPLAAIAESAARDAGFLVNAPAPDVLRLAPPLVVREEQLDAFVSALPGVLDAARVGAS
jgi:acetylornithine aminotransferase